MEKVAFHKVAPSPLFFVKCLPVAPGTTVRACSRWFAAASILLLPLRKCLFTPPLLVVYAVFAYLIIIRDSHTYK